MKPNPKLIKAIVLEQRTAALKPPHVTKGRGAPLADLAPEKRGISVSDLGVDDFGRVDERPSFGRWPYESESSADPQRPTLETYSYGLGALDNGPSKKEAKLPVVAGTEGALVWAAGEWVATKPTDDHTQEFPFLSEFARPAVVPTKLQKQPADRGTFYTPAVASEALGKTARFGLYLPPGFDPASDTKYPVLTLLPGRGGELNQWTSVGGIIPMLNSMMSGDQQKMIVVIADNTNSFWFDYDKNGIPRGAKEKEYQPRNYESHVDELLEEVVREYNGDPEQLSIGGISRGGAGALQLASRHPGKFVSASSQSGLLAFDHGGGLLSGIATELKSHFGNASSPAWEQFTPFDLLKNRALDPSTKLYLEVGADDADMLPGNLDYIALAKSQGLPIEHAVWGERPAKDEGKKGKKRKEKDELAKTSNIGHNWDLWAKTLPATIAFHQRALGGKAGKTKVDATFTRRDPELLQQRAQALKERAAVVTSDMAGIKSDVKVVAQKLGALALPLPRDFEPGFLRTFRALQAEPSLATRKLAQSVAEVEAELPDLPLFAQEARVGELRAFADQLMDPPQVREHLIGEPMPRLSTKASGLNALPKPVRADLKALVELVPEAKDALAQLANQSPELLSRVDPLTSHPGTFANHLLHFAQKTLLKEERAGFADYLQKMAHAEWDWRRETYSHTVNSATSIPFRHPGIVLDLIQAARENTMLEYGQAYPGDGGSKVLGPRDSSRDDLIAGFRPVPMTFFDRMELPSAQLGYERGFLRMVKYELTPDGLPPDRFGAICGPIAVAMAKLVGQDYRYGYLHKIKTGADLVEAMASQGEYGLSLAEAWVSTAADPTVKHLHFPHFSDFDPATRTVVMQEWQRGRQRVSVDGLQFATTGGAQPVAGYFLTGKGHEGIQKFWTRDAEPKPKPPPPPASRLDSYSGGARHPGYGSGYGSW